MSTVSQNTFAPQLAAPNRKQLWWLAALSPILLAPIWLAIPGNYLGPLQPVSGLILVLLLVTSSVTDLSRRKIYNWTTYTALAWAIGINLIPSGLMPSAVQFGSIGLGGSLIGAAVCFAIMLFPYVLARGGAGDVKLATAIGALVGVDAGLLVIAFAYIVAAVTIAGWTIWAKGPLNLLSALVRKLGSRWFPQYVMSPSDQQSLLLEQPIPLAGFFAIATLLVVLDVPAFLRSL